MSNIPPTAFKLSKPQLDAIATILGMAKGFCIAFIANDVGNPKTLGLTAMLIEVLMGYVTQKPASQHPTTAETERKKINE